MRFLLSFLASFGLAGAQVSAVFPPAGQPVVLGAMADLVKLAVEETPTGSSRVIAGYYQPNDGGGGTFYYDASSSAPPDGGAAIAPAHGSGRWRRIFNGPINVRQFGARGDGVADDTRKIQAAIDFAAAWSPRAPGAEVFFPAGFTGLVTSPLLIPSGLSGFSLVGEAPQDDPRLAQIQYRGPLTRPILVFTYSFVGHAGFQLTADAAIGAAAGSAAAISPSPQGYLASGASERGSLGSVHGILSNRAGTYRFMRDSAGPAEAWSASLDCYVPDLPSPGANIRRDRAGIVRNLSLTGDGNAVGILFQGHGSAELLDNTRVGRVGTAVQIAQPPAAGNDEFLTFHRCNLSGYQCGLWIANGDSYAVTVESCSIGIDPSVIPSGGPRAAIRVLGPGGGRTAQNGAGLNVYGGNIGTSDDRRPNDVAALEVSGVGDPISFNGVRSECVATAVRLLNDAGGGRAIRFEACSFTMNPRQLPVFSARAHFDRGIFLTHQGRTYRVLTGGTSGAAGPVTTSKAAERNGTLSVAFVAATGAQDDYASYSYLVEAGNYPDGDGGYLHSAGKHALVAFASSSFGLNLPARGGLAIDAAEDLSLRYDQCVFGGRLFESTATRQPMIVKSQCSFNPWPSHSQFIYDDSEVGASVNLLRQNGDPAPPSWAVGGSAVAVALAGPSPPPPSPATGKDGFELGAAGPAPAYDTPAAMVGQKTGIAANLETGDDGYVLSGMAPRSSPDEPRNAALVVAVTDAKGFILAKGIYGRGSRFSLPFAVGDARLAGQVWVWAGAMDLGDGGPRSSVAMLQVGRNRDHAYIRTGGQAIDGSRDGQPEVRPP